MKKHYENVALNFKDNWVRMEITKLKELSVSDVKKTLTDLFEFLRNFQYIDKMMDIKSSVYEKAANAMKTNKATTETK